MKISSLLFSVLILICFAGNSVVKAQSKTIFLVRHAEKEKTVSPDPDLDQVGLQRAQRLASLLSSAEVAYVYSSDYKRTMQTGQPLATMIGNDIIKYDPRDGSTIDNMMNTTGDSRVLIIGHSNTIPGMVNQLINEEKYDQLDEMEYDKLFIVTISEDQSDCIVITF